MAGLVSLLAIALATKNLTVLWRKYFRLIGEMAAHLASSYRVPPIEQWRSAMGIFDDETEGAVRAGWKADLSPLPGSKRVGDDLDAKLRPPRMLDHDRFALNYGRGGGFTDKQWKGFDTAQIESAKRNDQAAARLRSAALAMETVPQGEKFDRKTRSTIKDFEWVMGAGAATVDNMNATADRYDIANTVLRDRSAHMATGYTREEYNKLRPSKEGYMMTPGSGTGVNVNLGHLLASDGEFRRWGVGHEPWHTKLLRLIDQRGANTERAYYNGDAPQRASFKELTKTGPSRSLTNPDHLTLFAQKYYK
jgi:hypothetical protein